MFHYLKKSISNIICYIALKKENFFYNLGLRKAISKYSSFLSEGTYELLTGSDRKKIFYLRNNSTLKFICDHKQNLARHKQNIFVVLVDSLFKLKIVKSECQKFLGHLLLLTYNKDIKIFDFNNHQVLTIYHDKEKFILVESAFKNLNPFFNFTDIYFSYNNFYQIEHLICQKCYEQLSKYEKDYVFQKIILQYTEYFRQTDHRLLQRVIPEELCKELEKKIPKSVRLRIERILLTPNFRNISFPRVFLHGDLNSGNIFADGEQVKMIDLEHAGNFVFIYDIFYLISYEAIARNNFFLLKEYCNGMYDDLLLNLFSQLGMVYDANTKIKYVAVVLAERLLNVGISRNPMIGSPGSPKRNDSLLLLNEIERLYFDR